MNLEIDKKLVEEARAIGNHRTARAAVIAALEEYIRGRKQLQILDHFGTIDFAPKYDYKKMRRLDRVCQKLFHNQFQLPRRG